MKHLPLLAASLAVLAAGCSPQAPTPVEEEDTTSSSEAMTDNVEYGVSYQGILEEAGISIYMQGSHRLTTADGGFILLESDEVDLNAYLGAEVEVYGDARDSVEGGGTVLTVTDVSVLAGPASSVMSSEMSSQSSSTMSSVLSSQGVSAAASVTVRSSVKPAPVAKSSVVAKSSPAPAPAAASSVFKDAITLRAEAMAKANMAPTNWTRQYCPPQRDFCFAIHKNWYYYSFGTTTSYLWHVEVSNEAITSLGDGPISVNMVSGTSAEKGGSSGDVITKGDFVVGYFDWKDGNHFEILAPAILEPAVRHITQSIVPAPASSAAASAGSSR